MSWSDPTYAGPTGQMRVLPPWNVSQKYATDPGRLQAKRRTLAGGLTRDTFGRKASLQFGYTFANEADLSLLDALDRGGEQWLTDPRRNRFSREIASTGGDSRSAAAFNKVAASSSLAWRTLLPGDQAPGVGTPGCLAWAIDPAVSASDRIDVIPRNPVLVNDPPPQASPIGEGEQVTMSVWIRTSPAVQIAVGGVLYGSAARPLTPVEYTSPYERYASTQWVRRQYAFPVIAGTAAVLPRILAIADTGGVRYVDLTGMQLDAGLAINAWTPGGGSKRVLFDIGKAEYAANGTYAVTMTAEEV